MILLLLLMFLASSTFGVGVACVAGSITIMLAGCNGEMRIGAIMNGIVYVSYAVLCVNALYDITKIKMQLYATLVISTIVQVLWLFPRLVLHMNLTKYQQTHCNDKFLYYLRWSIISAVILHCLALLWYFVDKLIKAWKKKHILDKIAQSTTVDDDSCAICCEESKDDPFELLVCKHSYCKKCLINSVLHNPMCPLCRRPVGGSLMLDNDERITDPLLGDSS